MQTIHTAEYIDGLMDVLIVLHEYEVEIIPTDEGLFLSGDFIEHHQRNGSDFPLSNQPDGITLSLHGEAGTDDDFDRLDTVLSWLESARGEARKTAIKRAALAKLTD